MTCHRFSDRLISARSVGALVAALLGAGTLNAQPVPADWPQANPADVESIDSIITSLYAVISGPPGEERDWDRFKSLHHPEARLIPTGRNEAGAQVVNYWSLDDYIAQVGDWFLQNGFWEREAHRIVERFGSIAHAFSTYESFRTEEDEQPFQRGINSIQLLQDGDRWWILNIFWQGVGPQGEIPDRYLGTVPDDG